MIKVKPFPLMILFIILIAIVIFIINVLQNTSNFPRPVGMLKTTNNKILQANMNSFMESQKSTHLIGGDNYHCSNLLYGYDEKYAYAWMYCSGFVVNDGHIEQGSAFSSPARFEYSEPDFTIVNVTQPQDGAAYAQTLKQLFVKDFYELAIKNPSEVQRKDLAEETKSKAIR